MTWRPVNEGVLFFLGAIIAVWLWREGLIFQADDAAWLIPLTWIVAAVVATWPLLTDDRDLFTVRQWFGSPRVTVQQLVLISVIVLMPFSAAYVLYQGWWRCQAITPVVPEYWGRMVFYQLVYIGFSEELFFRGYLQQRFDDAFGRPYQFFGASCGVGLLIANLLFTAGHVFVSGDVARLDVFFPGLLFGWLLARTGALIAPVLFHGLSNIALFTMQSWVS